MAEESLKREFRIDSSDSARPAATLDSECQHYAQGLKPKARIISGVAYRKLEGQTVPRGKNIPPAQLFVKTTTYDDGTEIDTTVGEDNPEYQNHLKGIERHLAGTAATRRFAPVRKPAKPTSKKG